MFGTTDLLTKALDASWKRNEVISNNIANVDTPGYKRKDVLFEQYLKDAIQTNQELSSHKINQIKPQVVEDRSNLSYRLDENNVNIDTEMAYLAQNQIKYNTLLSQVNYNFSRLKMVMNR